MPKKSNKTAHVLSLLTSGSELLDEDTKDENINDQTTNEIIVKKADGVSTPTMPSPKSEVVVEMPGAKASNDLSDLVKSGLEKELHKDLAAGAFKTSAADSEDSGESPHTGERPPYSSTFMAKFGMDSLHNKPEEEKLPLSLSDVKSEIYILEDFNDEVEEEMDCMEERFVARDTLREGEDMGRILHNIVEDIVKQRVPEIMESLNMCCCQDCVYDVMALTLNNTRPKYTVSLKGQLFQKLTTYETQCGTDLTSEITKACIKVKINPNHPK